MIPIIYAVIMGAAGYVIGAEIEKNQKSEEKELTENFGTDNVPSNISTKNDEIPATPETQTEMEEIKS